jgi:plastocyanin
VLLLGAAPAHAAAPGPGVQRIRYMVGPIDVTPGQNRISYRVVSNEKPAVDGWITRIKPNLVRADGSVPPTNQVMFHHGVWLNLSAKDSTSPDLPERFFATGEEKTTMSFPKGFGLRYHASDKWLLNHMIHNLTPRAMTLYVSYTLDFIPDTSPAAQGMRPVRPIWMDVQNGKQYPVFNVHRGSGTDGHLTYPTQDPNAYPDGVQRNLWQADRDGVLVATAGHLHTGGLYNDLYLRRTGARYRGPDCAARPTTRQRSLCRSRAPAVRGNRAHLFRSVAKYYEPFGPVSWDVAMKATPPNWRVAVHKGDILETTVTYETKRASWYESMGIMFMWMADGEKGPDPFTDPIKTTGEPTHGHLAENDNHGGGATGLPDARTLPDGQTIDNRVGIFGFNYTPGNLGLGGGLGNPPTVPQGQALSFDNPDAAAQVFHTVTACKAPCNGATGISYPLADGDPDFDSGELGYGPTGFTAAANKHEWLTATDLKPGTYTYFCRVHPYMRGAFRVK